MSYIIVMWSTPERVKIIEELPGNTKLFASFEEAAKVADDMIDAHHISESGNTLRYKVIEI